MQVELNVVGAEHLDMALKELGRSTARTVLRGALRKAARPIAKEAALLAPRSGDGEGKPLADSMVIRTRLTKWQRYVARQRGDPEHFAVVYVGPAVPHAHLVEFGHVLVKGRGENRRVIGFVGPTPYLRPAFESRKKEALEILRKAIWANIERTAKRWAKQAEKGKLSKAAVRALHGIEKPGRRRR